MNIESLTALNEIIESKDDKIRELEDKLETMKRIKENAHDRWDETSYVPRDDFRKDLPVPRLEMIYWAMEYGSAWTYGIVRLAHKGMREDWNSKELVFVPLSQTTTTGDIRQWEGKGLDTPFRDASYFKHDMVALNLPGFLTCPSLEMIQEMKPMGGDHLKEYQAELKNN